MCRFWWARWHSSKSEWGLSTKLQLLGEPQSTWCDNSGNIIILNVMVVCLRASISQITLRSDKHFHCLWVSACSYLHLTFNLVTKWAICPSPGTCFIYKHQYACLFQCQVQEQLMIQISPLKFQQYLTKHVGSTKKIAPYEHEFSWLFYVNAYTTYYRKAVEV